MSKRNRSGDPRNRSVNYSKSNGNTNTEYGRIIQQMCHCGNKVFYVGNGLTEDQLKDFFHNYLFIEDSDFVTISDNGNFYGKKQDHLVVLYGILEDSKLDDVLLVVNFLCKRNLHSIIKIVFNNDEQGFGYTISNLFESKKLNTFLDQLNEDDKTKIGLMYEFKL